MTQTPVAQAPGREQPGIMPLSIREIMDIANVFAKSQMFKDVKTPEQAAVLIMAGLGMGIQPFAAVKGIRMTANGITVDVHLLAAQIKRSKRYDYHLKTLNMTACVIEFYQDGKLMGDSTYTINEATKAGLMSRQNWTNNTQDMLYAAAMRKGAKRFCPDALSGIDIAEADAPEAEAEPARVSPEAVREYMEHDDGDLTAEAPMPTPEAPTAQDEVPEPEPQPAPEPPTPPAAPRNGNGASGKATKRAEVMTPAWSGAAAVLAQRVPYYAKGGKPDWYHMTISAFKLGYAEITDANMQEVLGKLEKHAAEAADKEAARE